MPPPKTTTVLSTIIILALFLGGLLSEGRQFATEGGTAASESALLVRPPDDARLGQVGRGAGLTGAAPWHSQGYTGAGVKVAVLDKGFSGYEALQRQGELPANIITHWAPSIGGPGASDHGAACAEIVHDIAPDALIYLANFDGESELSNAVDWLITQGVQVISMSISYPTGGPGDGTGPVARIVDRARSAGILWVQAAGNYGAKHWQGEFRDADSNLLHDFSLAPADGGNTIIVKSGDHIKVRLKWEDQWGASGNDYNLLLMDRDGVVVASSTNVQNGDDDPKEALTYTARYSGEYEIAVKASGSPIPVTMHLYSLNHDLQYRVASGSLVVPADSPGAMTVGAVRWSAGAIEPYSSQGPTVDGRQKPDLVAPDGALTATRAPRPFYGTSAAAPHVAGAAALVQQRYPSYTPAEVQSFLESRALDLGAPGKDNLFGSGLLDLGAVP